MGQRSHAGVAFTEGERREFKNNGFLVIPDAIDEELLAPMREMVWESIEEDPRSRTDLVEAEYRNLGGSDPTVASREPFVPLWEQMYAYANELVGGDRLVRPERSDLDDWLSLNLNFPDEGRPEDPEAPQPSEKSGHTDGFGRPLGDPPGFTIAGTLYVDRVPPRGGGLMVWPGSHWASAEFFESHDLDEYVDHQSDDSKSGPPYETGDPFELAGGAGTLVLWHGQLLHTTGVNLGSNVRIGLFKRFGHEDRESHWREALAEPFEHWPAMRDVDTKGAHLS